MKYNVQPTVDSQCIRLISQSYHTETTYLLGPACCDRAKLVENFSKPSIANFGRSLFGGYCPTYVPDFVLHGLPSDDKLKQGLMADLYHAVQVGVTGVTQR